MWGRKAGGVRALCTPAPEGHPEPCEAPKEPGSRREWWGGGRLEDSPYGSLQSHLCLRGQALPCRPFLWGSGDCMCPLPRLTNRQGGAPPQPESTQLLCWVRRGPGIHSCQSPGKYQSTFCRCGFPILGIGYPWDPTAHGLRPWLLLLGIMFSASLQVLAGVRALFLFMAK